MALAVAIFKGKLGLSLMNIYQPGKPRSRRLSATKTGLRTESGISLVTGKTTIITSGISFPYGIAILAGTIAAYLI